MTTIFQNTSKKDSFLYQNDTFNKDFSMLFSLNLTPKWEFMHKFTPKIWQDSWKSTLFFENGCFDTLVNTIPEFPYQSKKKKRQNKTKPLFPIFLVVHAYSIILSTAPVQEGGKLLTWGIP